MRDMNLIASYQGSESEFEVAVSWADGSICIAGCIRGNKISSTDHDGRQMGWGNGIAGSGMDGANPPRAARWFLWQIDRAVRLSN